MTEFVGKLSSLARFCSGVLKEADGLGIEYNKKLSTTVESCVSLIGQYASDQSRSEKVMGNVEDFFKANYDLLCQPLVEIGEDGTTVPVNNEWIAIDQEKDLPGPSGYRKLCIAPNRKYPNICIPLSEIYDLTIKIVTEDADKEYYVIRLLYYFMSCMAAMRPTVDTDKYDTEDMLPPLAILENAAQIPSVDMMNQMKSMDFSKMMNENMLKEMSTNFDPTKLMGMLKGFTGIEDMGPVAAIMGHFGKMLTGQEGDPADQD